MSNILSYKNFLGSVDIDLDDFLIYGKILFIDDSIGYDSKNPEGIQKAFEDAVDDYLAFCKEINKEPNIPFSGKTAIRFAPELHKQIAYASTKACVSMNDYMVGAIIQRLEYEKKSDYQNEEAIRILDASSQICKDLTRLHQTVITQKLDIHILNHPTAVGAVKPILVSNTLQSDTRH